MASADNAWESLSCSLPDNEIIGCGEERCKREIGILRGAMEFDSPFSLTIGQGAPQPMLLPKNLLKLVMSADRRNRGPLTFPAVPSATVRATRLPSDHTPRIPTRTPSTPS